MSSNDTSGLGRYQSMRRLVLAALIVAMFAALLFGQSTFPPDTTVHEVVEMVGILLIFLGIVGRLWCTLYIGGRKSGEVVTGGPYSITRNPLYVFSTLAAAGVGAQMGSVIATIGFAVLCAAAFHVVILREERHLGELFGRAYQAYVARVPRFFPKLSLSGRRHRQFPAKAFAQHLARRPGVPRRAAGFRTDRPRPGHGRTAGAVPHPLRLRKHGGCGCFRVLRCVKLPRI